MPKVFVLHLLVVWSLILSGQSASAMHQPPSSPIYTWNRVALDTVRTQRLSDAQAARVYAMVNVAMYDAINGIESVQGEYKRESALVSSAGAPVNGNRYAAASAAAHAVLTQLHPILAGTYQA